MTTLAFLKTFTGFYNLNVQRIEIRICRLSRELLSNDTVLFMVITTSNVSELKSDRQLSLDICRYALRDAATRLIK